MLRDRALAFFTVHLGDPEPAERSSGRFLRWVLPRKGQLGVHVTFMFSNPASHGETDVMISDPTAPVVERMVFLTIRSEADFAAVLDRARTRMQGP